MVVVKEPRPSGCFHIRILLVFQFQNCVLRFLIHYPMALRSSVRNWESLDFINSSKRLIYLHGAHDKGWESTDVVCDMTKGCLLREGRKDQVM